MANSERVQHLYDRAAKRYDAVTRQATLNALRARLLSGAFGDVLELGVGTGATFAHYPLSLHSLTALDVSGAMLRGARVKALPLPFPVRLMQRDFQTLPFPEGSFDTAVSSLALCGIPDPQRLFSELRRVLRPGGQLLALEHVRPPNALLASVANLLDPLFDHVVGCHLNRPTSELLHNAGFRVEVRERRLGGILVALKATPEQDGSA
ncbi:class I SAM-dependent methyltransferase [Deinococcus marmoris]|uniref:Phosphatidylethanolamine N-methyltransferase n=1 Tax=Deinococcus marmoris TaxID=249408 RepID=A0A1U7NWK2_9DEIO|nr:methyltransferase domain-containing protein [Deinococcus marmoris]OLV17286.1 Phosphatidylethanolamine N-methyltransferase [Deinococcus marmoris]OLV18653.1 Ubiquinone/menaquinone biosynthesis methyltransferase UbiE [Deinococcus marmoris]